MGWGGKVACVLTPSAAFNWSLLARKECLIFLLLRALRMSLPPPSLFMGVDQEGRGTSL